MKEQQLELQEIGRYDNGCICMLEAFRDGLLHLESFSNAIVFYKMGEKLASAVFTLAAVDMKRGIIKCSGASLPEASIIYDVKPYFPCEDYVKNCALALKQNKLCGAEILDTRLIVLGHIIRNKGHYELHFDAAVDCERLFRKASHLKIIWWFHRFDKPRYRKTTQCNPPYERAPRCGVFATRSPVRPNPLALTSARILGIEKNIVRVTRLDCFDGTPLLGVAAYDPEKDRVDNAAVPEWLAHWPRQLDDSDYRDGDLSLALSPLVELLQKQQLRSTRTQTDCTTSGTAIRHEAILVKGARQNNLKAIDVSVPYNKITAICGVSGSGKSSLAFDTIYTECRRRFLDASGVDSSDAKPAFDSMQGIIPAIAVSQKSITGNSRSTLATVSGMSNLLRQLYASIGLRYCPDCGEPLVVMSRDAIVQFLLKQRKVRICTLDGEDMVMPPEQAVDSALERGKGAFYASVDDGESFVMQTRQMCFHCDRIIFDMHPSLFSFNDPESMCPVCSGRGITSVIDEESVIIDGNLSLLDGASRFHGKLRSFLKNPNHNWMKGEVFALADDLQVDLETPWRELPAEFKRQYLYGSEGRVVRLHIDHSKTGRKGEIQRQAEGVINILQRLMSERSAASFAPFVKDSICPACQGERLSREGRMVIVAGKRFPEISAMSVRAAADWCKHLLATLPDNEYEMVATIVQHLYKILCTCIDLGLGYLTLDRSVPTLSGGELQRIKLVAQLCGDISGVLYIFDEPSAGLHPKDYERLWATLLALRDRGNSIVFVEHNRDLISKAENIIEIGPQAGAAGGYLVIEGSVEELLKTDCESARYLRGDTAIAPKAGGLSGAADTGIKIYGARCHNLKSIDVEFPAAAISCICGVSGSGKSSLLRGVLYPSVSRYLAGDPRPVECEKIESIAGFSSVVLADQSPIGRTPRSVPATYTGIMDELRKLFASSDAAKRAGFDAGHFSFNAKSGQCDHCGGDGMIAAAYLDNVWITCPVCEGRRYKQEVLAVRYKDKSIHDVLEMSVDEARELFCANVNLTRILRLLDDVGLSYLRLGQNSATLSGGEAQRLKLAKSLCSAKGGNTLYLLDEPTSGLHGSDIAHLFSLLRALADDGNTVIMIEHHADIVACVDHIVDLGPEGGEAGGSLIAAGRPAEIANCRDSYTGKSIAKLLR